MRFSLVGKFFLIVLLSLFAGCSSLWPVNDKTPKWASSDIQVIPLQDRVAKRIEVDTSKEHWEYASDKENKVLHSTLSAKVVDSEIVSLVPFNRSSSAVVQDSKGNVYLLDLVVSGGQRTFYLEKIAFSSEQISQMAISGDDKYLAMALFSRLAVIELDEGKLVRSTSRVKGRVKSLAWGSTGRMLVGGLADGKLFSWDLEVSGQEEHEIDWYIGAVSSIVSVAFHPSGRSFFATERDGRLWLWRLIRTEKELGIRDPRAIVDKQNRAGLKFEIPRGSSKVQELLVSKSSGMLLGVSEEGYIVPWKLRGLVAGRRVVLSDDKLVELVEIPSDPGGSASLFASVKNQRFARMCLDSEQVRSSKSKPGISARGIRALKPSDPASFQQPVPGAGGPPVGEGEQVVVEEVLLSPRLEEMPYSLGLGDKGRLVWSGFSGGVVKAVPVRSLSCD